jgi:hypothetical protein
LDVTKDTTLVAAVRDFRDRVAELEVEIDALRAKVSHQRRLQFNLKRGGSPQDGDEFQGVVQSIQHLAASCTPKNAAERHVGIESAPPSSTFLTRICGGSHRFHPRSREAAHSWATSNASARASASVVQAAQCPIGHARSRMAGCSQAPVLILTAPDALAPAIAVAVRTAAAQRERGRDRR